MYTVELSIVYFYFSSASQCYLTYLCLPLQLFFCCSVLIFLFLPFLAVQCMYSYVLLWCPLAPCLTFSVRVHAIWLSSDILSSDILSSDILSSDILSFVCWPVLLVFHMLSSATCFLLLSSATCFLLLSSATCFSSAIQCYLSFFFGPMLFVFLKGQVLHILLQL